AVLRRIDGNRFYDLGSNVITFANVNGVMRCSLAITGEVYFSGNKLPHVQFTDMALAQASGTYYSGELDATYTLAVEHGRLMVRAGDNPPTAFEPATRYEFYSSDFRTLVLSVNANGDVSGFRLFTQAARGITFERVH
ncbi:MAG: hypothetical protein ACRD3E_12750, partial [Terriglobales bacterium]